MVCLQCKNCVIHTWALQRWASHDGALYKSMYIYLFKKYCDVLHSTLGCILYIAIQSPQSGLLTGVWLCWHDVEKSRLAKKTSFANQSTVEGSTVLPPTIAAAIAPSPGVRPPTAAVPVTPPAAAMAARGGWTNGDWLLTSMYQQRIREAAYRCEMGSLWAAAVHQHHYQQQQQTGHYWFTSEQATNIYIPAGVGVDNNKTVIIIIIIILM